MRKIINIKEPDISNIEKREVLKCLKKSEISTYGSLVSEIGKKLNFYNNAKYNLTLNSGTAALQLGFKSAGVCKDDIVITQSFTFGATLNSIINSAADAWLFDVDKFTLSIDLIQLENSLKTKTFFKNGFTYMKKNKKKVFGICLVTSFGIIPDLTKLKKISNKYKLKIIIDGACAFGNKYNGRPLIEYADVVIYSFNGNKNFTSGGGGVLSTNKKNIYTKAKILSENGKIKGNYTYSMFGYNYKMTNLHAAILKGQLSRYFKIKKKLANIHQNYLRRIKNINFFFFTQHGNKKNIFWLNFVLCKSETISKKLISYLNKKKIRTNYFWKPMHLQPYKKKFLSENMKFTNKFFKRVVLIPSSSFLKKKELDYVIKVLNSYENDKKI